MTNLKKDSIIALVATGVACFTAACFFSGYSPIQLLTFPLAPSMEELCDAGQPIVAELERYREVHGQYPADLAEVGSKPSKTFFGDWQYKSLEDGLACELSVGDYSRYGFVVSWMPESKWHIDS